LSYIWQAIVQAFADTIQYLYHVTVAMGVPSYGLAIILVTVLIKFVLYPLTNKQMKSMRQMQQIQPKMKVIQERFKDDPQRMQKELMELYKQHGVSPLSGCLPLLVQLPILLAFYRALYTLKYVNVAHAGFFWVSNLSEPDKLSYLFGINHPIGGFFPLLAGVTTYIQQRISTVDANDPTQRTMLYAMPVFIAWMAGSLPAGLALYWVTFNILSIAQQVWVNARVKPLEVGGGATVLVERAMAGASQGENVSGDKGGSSSDGVRRKKRKKRG